MKKSGIKKRHDKKKRENKLRSKQIGQKNKKKNYQAPIRLGGNVEFILSLTNIFYK